MSRVFRYNHQECRASGFFYINVPGYHHNTDFKRIEFETFKQGGR